ncbi:MAG: hypothetical protein H6748_04425 [Spirochaetaceae bacterium]|nr:hypothetical protein [Myxococcales bacterium]MCB9723277.1 hypothetical protein [Spirochaetaceae bacterium]HPG24402.1 hypothetical protein [Myxococcota bacterium]
MTSDDSVYRAPTSALARPSEGGARSLEAAMAGEFEFDVGSILREGWDLVSGSKAVILGGYAVLFGVNLLGSMVGVLASGTDPESVSAVGLVASVASALVQMVVQAGLYLYAIKRAAGDDSASFDDVFAGFAKFGTLVGVAILSWLLILFGFVLLIVPGVYLAIAYQMAMPLVIERGLGLWDALETSRKAITHCWFRYLLVLLVAGLGAGVAAILTLGIGAIWALPFFTLCMGTAYVRIFGHGGARD